MKIARVLAHGAAATLLATACSDDPVRSIPVHTLSVSSTDTLVPGDRAQLVASTLDANGSKLRAAIQWRSTDSTVASVNAQGEVHALTTGNVMIVAEADAAADTVDIVVGVPPAISLAGIDSIPLFAVVTLSASATGRGGAPARASDIVWSSTDSNVAYVLDTLGKVRSMGEGEAQIIARLGTAADTLSVRTYLRWVTSPVPLTSLAIGWSGHRCGLGTDSRAYCWGVGANGQLGLGASVTVAEQPTAVGAATYSMVIAADNHSCAVDGAGGLWCWGNNSYYQVAPDTSAGAKIRDPRRVRTDTAFARVMLSQHGTICAITAANEPYCWGHNDFFQIGREPLRSRDSVIARVSTDILLSEIAGSGFTTCGLDPAGAVWCWGDGWLVHEGNRTPTPVKRADGPFRAVSVGLWAVCVIHMSDDLLCWGDNRYGTLGLGHSDAAPGGPLALQTVSGGVKWSAVAVATAEACAISTDGELFCWGSRFARPGNLAATPRSILPSLRFRTVATDIVGGYFCALTGDGTRIICF